MWHSSALLPHGASLPASLFVYGVHNLSRFITSEGMNVFVLGEIIYELFALAELILAL